MVLADETANPVYVAADLLSQAEHDEMASAILVTTSAVLAEAVQAEVQRQLEARRGNRRCFGGAVWRDCGRFHG